MQRLVGLIIVILATGIIAVQFTPVGKNGDLLTETRLFSDVKVQLANVNDLYSYEFIDRASVTIQGDTELLGGLDPSAIKLVADVGSIEPGGSENVSVACELPDGVTLVNLEPSEVTVTVTTHQDQTATILEGMEISLLNRVSDYSYSAPDPVNCQVTVEGDNDQLNSFDAHQVEAYVDVQDLEPGSYSLVVMVDLPEGLSYSVDPGQVTVTIDLTDGTEKAKTIMDVSIGVNGEKNNLIYTLSKSTCTMMLKSQFSVRDEVSSESVKAYVDVSELGPGTHMVRVQHEVLIPEPVFLASVLPETITVTVIAGTE